MILSRTVEQDVSRTRMTTLACLLLELSLFFDFVSAVLLECPLEYFDGIWLKYRTG